MTVMESIRNFLCACPLLREGVMRVDYLGDQPTEYVVEAVPTEQLVKRYSDGGSLREFVFVFGSREYYGGDVVQNLSNSDFYEKFSQWLDTAGLPALSDGRTAQSIAATSCGFVFDAAENNARYQIQCRLLYYQNERG